jgi:hypothetical protein
MDDKSTDLLLRVSAGALTGAGVVAVLFGYLGVRDEADLALQVPYLMSGGLGGLALVGLGALCLIHLQMRRQAQRMAQLTDELDEWKDRAIGEIRTFLASAVVEIELDAEEPQPEVIRRTASGSSSRTATNGRRTQLVAR